MQKLYRLIIFFILIGCSAHADSSSKLKKSEPGPPNSSSTFSFRVRPFALAQGIWGAEAFFKSGNGWFIGPTAHFFSGNNDIKLTSLINSDFGIKFGRLFSNSDSQKGFFILGSVDLENTTISSFYTPTGQRFTVQINQMSESVFAGYQFRATFISEHHWDYRLGLGLAYKPELISTFKALDGNSFPIGARKRLDPSLEFTVGYEI